MKDYNIYRKRDGQSFELWGSIYASNFKDAKKQFAKDMTSDNFELSNNIVWLDKNEGIKETGWYDFDASIIKMKPDPEDNNYEVCDYKNSEMELFCSEKEIKKGFDTWSEDVYMWELRK